MDIWIFINNVFSNKHYKVAILYVSDGDFCNNQFTAALIKYGFSEELLYYRVHCEYISCTSVGLSFSVLRTFQTAYLNFSVLLNYLSNFQQSVLEDCMPVVKIEKDYSGLNR